MTAFKYNGTFIVEDIAIRNIENELYFIRIILEHDNWRELISKREYKLAEEHNFIDEEVRI